MKRSLCGLVLLVLTTVAVAPALLAQDNPFVGTWKLNTAKSKFEGTPAPKSLTRTVTAQGNGAKYSFEGVAADGSSFAYSFATNYDGMDAPITGTGAPGGADMVSLKKMGDRRTEGTLKKGGKEIAKVTSEVSKEGKVTWVKSKGKSADGKDVWSESAYDKQ
jgi:hypothetical protein